jgi:antitoxin VapB
MFPLVSFDHIPLAQANECLVKWGHRMGALHRPFDREWWHYALFAGDRPVAVAMTSPLIREHVGGGLSHLTRENCVELSRLCAERRDLCRVVLRLWREFVFPVMGYPFAISYQDADLHTGNTYRFDGWKRMAYVRGGGTDARSGRKGRNRYIWVWEKP